MPALHHHRTTTHTAAAVAALSLCADTHLGVTLALTSTGWVGSVDGVPLYFAATRNDLLADIDTDLLPEPDYPCGLCHGSGTMTYQPTPWANERTADCPDCLGSGVA